VPPLSEHINFEASSRECELILEGEYDTAELDEITALLIRNMKKKTRLDAIPCAISEKQFVDKLKNWPERTSTSPSGIDLGHYNALIRPHNVPLNTEAGQEIEGMRKALLHAHVVIINYALKFGYSYKRWKVVVNIMIQKDPGNIKIHRLRVIHLYEADYNLILGVKWREAMHLAEDNKLLNDSQYGGRPGRNAHDPVFIEVMQAEICRTSRKSNIKFDVDATSCYDRIIPGLAGIASRKHGVHRKVVQVCGGTLEEARYKLKTLLGVSADDYHHCPEFPIYGTGQGSGNSPPIWTFMSSALFDCQEQRGHGATFATPDRSLEIVFHMIGFVDDSTGQVNEFGADPQPSPEHLIEIMRKDGQLWTDLLWSSGGALELPKCSYHYLHYMFTNDGAPILQGGQVGPKLTIRTGDRTKIVDIPSKSVFEAHKTLGTWQDPNGSLKKEERVKRKQSDQHGVIIQISAMVRHEAWTYYFAIYITSVGYSLPVCHFTRHRLDHIQRKAMNAIFSKCGFNKNTKRAILFGPSVYGGANFRHLYTEQGVGQILMFLKYWRTEGQQGTILRIALSWSQMAAGTSTSILEDVTTPLPHLESKWITSLRKYLQTIGGEFELDQDYVPPLQREYDEHIMDIIIDSGRYSDKELCYLNYCRIYLQASTISDLTDARGTVLDKAMLAGEPTILSSKTNLHRFNQSRPPKRLWNLWKRANSLWSNKDGRLFTSLGRWTVPPNELRRRWPAYFSPREQCLYTSKDPVYEAHRRNNQGSFNPNAVHVVTSLPRDSYPVQATLGEDEWAILQPSLPSLEPTTTPTPSTFPDFLASLRGWDHALFADLHLEVDPFTLIELLAGAKILGVSDGSAKCRMGSFGWVISTPEGRRLVYCAGLAPGNKTSSFRSEGYGMLSLIRFFLHLFTFCGQYTFPRLYLSTDNEGLLTRIEDDLDKFYKTPNATLAPDWDLVEEIVNTIALLPRIPRFSHVKGHQDDDVPYEELPLVAQLNVDADRYANKFMNNEGYVCTRVPRLGSNKAQLHVGGETINSHYKGVIRRAETGPILRAYIQERNNWNDTVMDSIEWEAHGSAISKFYDRRVHIIKLCHDLLPTGRIVHRYDKTKPHECIKCKAANEDRDHIIRCPHLTRSLWRSKCLKSLRDKCESMRTRPFLIDILVDGLQAWFNHLPPPASPHPKYDTLIDNQSAIGWSQLFNGRMSTEWSALQDDYLSANKIVDQALSGKQWVSGIVATVWKLWIEVWEDRNGEVHGRDATTREIAKKEQAMREVRAIYRYKELVCAEDRSLFRNNADIHLAEFSHSSAIINWVAIHKPLVIASMAQAKILSTLGVQPLTAYFQPRAQPVRIRRKFTARKPPKARTKTPHKHKRTKHTRRSR
jgi:hypothetical protein